MTSVVDSNINIATLFGLKGLLKSHNSVMKKHSDSKDHHWLSGISSEAYFGVLEFFGWILQADRCLLIRQDFWVSKRKIQVHQVCTSQNLQRTFFFSEKLPINNLKPQIQKKKHLPWLDFNPDSWIVAGPSGCQNATAQMDPCLIFSIKLSTLKLQGLFTKKQPENSGLEILGRFDIDSCLILGFWKVSFVIKRHLEVSSKSFKGGNANRFTASFFSMTRHTKAAFKESVPTAKQHHPLPAKAKAPHLLDCVYIQHTNFTMI